MMQVTPCAASTSTLSRNGKNASLAQAKPPFSTPSRSQKVLGVLAGQQCGVNAVGLTRTHANAGLALGDQDGVGLDALADLPGKLELGHLGVGGLAVGGGT